GEGVSAGRLPDGSNTMVQFPASASPGAPNYLPNISGVQLNDVLAAGTPDWIELHNPLTVAVDLGGMSVSINEREPRQWTFAAGTMLAAGGYLQVKCDSLQPVSTGGAAGFNTGRSINDSGSGVFLYDRFGQVTDFVEFGAQMLGMSIGKVAGFWRLQSGLSPGIANLGAATMGNENVVKLNEWMAAPLGGDDWFELFNPEFSPVNIGGFYVTDDPSVSGRTNSQLAQLTFIPARGFILLQADGERDKGPEHVAFSLDALGETLRLYNTTFIVDEIPLLVQAVGVSEGRYPDGTTTIAQFPGAATPAAPNAGPTLDSDGDGMPDAWEDTYGLNRLSAADALLDSDGDGMSNLDEYRAGTNPTNAASRLTLQIENQMAGQPVLIFNAAAGKSYTILAAEVVDAVTWNRVGNILPGVERQVELVDDNVGLRTRFYRIISPMQP
ncbi:MAG: lamin tail domain-containing protein, partial [Limisphaerales bacterium]